MCVLCVCAPCNHRDPFGFFFSAGRLVVHASTSPTKRLALNTDIGGDAHRRTCNFPFSEWHEAKPRTSLAADMSDRRHFDLFVAFDLALLASLPLTDLQAPMVLTGSLRKWNPRPACGTAISSVRISISVFGLVPTRDEPVEPPVDPSNGGLSLFPLLWKRKCPQRAKLAHATRIWMFVPSWNSKLAHAFT